MLKQTYKIPPLPPKVELETKAVLRALPPAHRFLAELKGKASAIPNQGILIDTLSLQEAKASSEIENIVTTQDEIFQHNIFPNGSSSNSAKEVFRYRNALKRGFHLLHKKDGLITNNCLTEMYRELKNRTDGFRTTSGTALKNVSNDKITYVPPQNPNDIILHMTALEKFINQDDAPESIDPIVKMAVIHHQFESIHPFPDGNGRIGRILNVLYLTKMDLLSIPILYLSRSIIQRENEYYNKLQAVRDDGDWEGWVLYVLNAVTETSQITLYLVEGIRSLMAEYKNKIRSRLPKIYSQDLLNNLFRHPYTRIEYLENDLGVSRQTAAKYLDQLVSAGLLRKHKSGTNNYYINEPLAELLIGQPALESKGSKNKPGFK